MEQLPAGDSPERKNRTSYFQNVTLRYLQEMRLLFRGGQLTSQDKWRNVAEHCVVQLAAAEVLADLLDLPPHDQRKLCSVAAVHDWRKRIDVGHRRLKKMDEGESKELFRKELDELEANAQSFAASVAPDPDLMRATGEEFLRRALVEKNATFLEKLQFYLDDICGDRATEDGKTVTDILPLRERIAEVSARRQDLNDDPSLTQSLGGKYWDRELELGVSVEHEIWERLGGESRGIAGPENLPAFLRSELQHRIAAFAVSSNVAKNEE